MRKLFLLLSIAAALAAPAWAQRTLVSGTVTDTNGVPWAGGTLVASLTLPLGASGATLNGVQIAGTTQRTSLDGTGSFLISLPDNTVVQPPGTQWAFSISISPGVSPPLGTGPQTCNATLTISGPSQSVTPSFSACPALSHTTGGGLPAGGTVGQVIVNTGPGAGTWQDPNVSLTPVNLFNAVSATATHTSANVKNPIYEQSGSLLVTFAGLTGTYTGCTIQLEAVDSLGNATNSGAAIAVTPSNGTQSIIAPVNASTTAPTYAAFIAAVWTCSAFGTGGTLSLDFAGVVGSPGHGTGGMSVGQWVQPGQAIIFQYTSQNGFPINFDLIADTKILLPNGQIQNARYEINPCNFTGNVASSGFAINQGGWLQTAVADMNTAGISWGNMLLNIYIANGVGTESTTSCGPTLSNAQIGASLGSWMVGSFLPTGFIGTTTSITHPWTIPGIQKQIGVANPSAGVDFLISLGPSAAARTCIVGLNFFLTASATVATRTVAVRFSIGAVPVNTSNVGLQSDLFYISPTDQTASQLTYYVLAPNAIPQSRTILGNSGTTPQAVTIPFAGGAICADQQQTITVASRILNIQAADQISSVFLWVTQQHDAD